MFAAALVCVALLAPGFLLATAFLQGTGGAIAAIGFVTSLCLAFALFGFAAGGALPTLVGVAFTAMAIYSVVGGVRDLRRE